MALNCNFYTFFVINFLLFFMRNGIVIKKLHPCNFLLAQGIVEAAQRVRSTAGALDAGTSDSPFFAPQAQKCAHIQKLATRKTGLPPGNKLQSLQRSKVFRVSRKDLVENHFFVRKKTWSRRAKMRFFVFANGLCLNV